MRSPRFRLRSFGPIEGRSDRPFFFQAEDGIRDDLVTGVQTCALPIWRSGPGSCLSKRWYFQMCRPEGPRAVKVLLVGPLHLSRETWVLAQLARTNDTCTIACASRKIGRASCRERV